MDHPTHTAQALALLVERATAPLLERISNLEEAQTGDGAAFAAQYQVTEEGAVEINESEVINELVSEEGDLIVGGKGKKAKTLKPGKPGQVLAVGEGGVLEWVEPGGGGGGLGGKTGLESLTPTGEDPEFPEFEEGAATIEFSAIGFEPVAFFCQAFRDLESENPGETNGFFYTQIDPKVGVVEVNARWKKLTPGPFFFFWLALK
jgi:hypothetical protein